MCLLLFVLDRKYAIGQIISDLLCLDQSKLMLKFNLFY
jgi:hypothetical protein